MKKRESGLPPAFEDKLVALSPDQLLPLKLLPDTVRVSRKYRQIAASIAAIGLIEPPVVARCKEDEGLFLLLDGHVRIDILKGSGVQSVLCLIATDDEAFTYNKRRSPLATVQEHKMILRAVERGTSEQLIAEALQVNVAQIRRKLRLLDGICPEAAELLKDKACPVMAFQRLKKMKPLRQIQAAEMMVAMNRFSLGYATALLAATPAADLADTAKPKAIRGLAPDQVERMGAEMASLQTQMKLVERSYGPDHLNLVLACGYVDTLLGNDRITRYLARNHSEILMELRRIGETVRSTCEAPSVEPAPETQWQFRRRIPPEHP